MTKVHGLIVAAALLAACKGKSKDEEKSAVPKGVTPAAADAGAAVAAAPDAAGAAAAPDQRCEVQCRFLANTPLADVATYYQDACGKAWVAPAAADCDALDYQRNCIYATAGYTFKKPKWQEAFAKQPWYTPRADFKEGDLSKVATANIRELKAQALECRGGDKPAAIPGKLTASKISAADKKTVVEWFEKKAKGELVLPAKLEADFQPATEAEMKQWFDSPHLFTLEEWTPFEYYEGDGKAGAPRTVYVGTSAASPDCVDDGNEGCEGFEVIYFNLDAAGKIVGISVTAAACPHVYVVGAGGAAAYQGEILRHLGRAAFERSQRLALDPMATCPAELTVRVAEEKDEVTYVDDVRLELDGHVLAPRACGGGGGDGGGGPAYCGDDGRYVTLAKGQSIELVFDVPAGASCGEMSLRADGYYTPTK